MTLFHFYHELNELSYIVLYCIILQRSKCCIEHDFVVYLLLCVDVCMVRFIGGVAYF